jgi:hypothetical protein
MIALRLLRHGRGLVPGRRRPAAEPPAEEPT